MSDLTMRHPVTADADAIAAIDRAGLATGHASFREDPHVWAKFEQTYLAGKGIALVCEQNSSILGWAGVASVSDRCVYSGVGEVSIYIAPNAQGRGVGKALLRDLIAGSEASRYWTLTAQIFPENTQSIALHKACGFRAIGRREKIGRMGYGPMAGCWRDTIMLERRSVVVGVD
jgi:phosphinothricin acetyltransferase